MVIIPSSHPPAKGPRQGHQHHSHNLLNVSCFRMPRRVQAGLYGSVNATWTSGMPTRPDFLLFGQSWIRLRRTTSGKRKAQRSDHSGKECRDHHRLFGKPLDEESCRDRHHAMGDEAGEREKSSRPKNQPLSSATPVPTRTLGGTTRGKFAK